MERDQAQLIRRRPLVPLVLAFGLSSHLLVACGGSGADGAIASTTSVGEVLVVDAEEFCERLGELEAADPFDGIFGNDSPMDAAAAFDNGQHVLDELVAVAPDGIAVSAEAYRDALAGFRDLVLPPDTIDVDDYEAAFDELRAQQDAARVELDRHLAEECAR